MIYFITNDDWHYNHYKEKLYTNIEVERDSLVTFTAFKEWMKDITYIGFDYETNGLDAYVNNTLLLILGNEENQVVLHTPFCNVAKYLGYIKDNDLTLLGHNIKFDLKFALTKSNIWFRKVYDTMVSEQRTYMKLGVRVGLDQLVLRYLDEYPDAMDKTIRKEFIGVDVNTFKVKPRHINYGVEDVINLFPIKEKQEKLLDRYNLQMLVKDIEFPMISIIAKAEITGFRFDKESWSLIADDNITKCHQIEKDLDKEVRRLRDKVWGVSAEESGLMYFPEKRMYMLGGKWDNVRKHNPAYDLFNDDGTTNTLNLFGEPMKINTYMKSKAAKTVKIKKNTNNINYNSDIQVIEIFGRLEEPLLNQDEKLVIPTFKKNGKVNKLTNSYKTNEPSMVTYLNMLPETKMKPFIKLLLEHRGLSKAVSTYGKNFINNLNPITGKIHTTFRQCFTETGRMSSGGGKLEPDKPNFQNIPSKADYAIAMRNCFMADEGYSIGTHDLSGAELIIMCSLSQDLKLLEIARQDIHSYVAQRCWRAIYKKRANELIKESQNPTINEEYRKVLLIKIQEFLELSETYIVDKSKPKIRTAFKPMTFGTIYGMYAGKASKTLGITKEEGQLVIDIIKREFPDVFKMVEQALKNATEKGYLILNSRTYSRAWFPNIIRVLQGKLDPRKSFKLISKEQSEARNIRIQGTQADMIKECTVELQKWIDDNNYTNEITLLSWVHDEIVDQHPKWMDGKSDEWKLWKFSTGLENKFVYTQPDGRHLALDSFPEVKAQIMRDVCNKYLDNVTMDVDYDVEPYWTK